MPDLLTHLGAGYLVARGLRLKDPRLMVVGSLLPDASTIAWKIPGVLGLYHDKMFPYLESMGTPFILLFVAAIAAALCRSPGRAFVQLYGACLLHVGMDMFPQGPGGQLLLYPYSLAEYSFHLYWNDSALAFATMAVSAAVLLAAIPGLPRTRLFHLDRRRAAAVAAFAAVVLVVPAFTLDRYVQENVCGLRFYMNPQEWEGREVELTLDLNGPGRDPRRFGTFRLETEEPLSLGDTVWVRGLHRGHVIYPLEMRKIDKRPKNWSSMAAWLSFLVVGLGAPWTGGRGGPGGPGPGSPPPSPPEGNTPPPATRARLWASELRRRLDRALGPNSGWAPMLV